MSDQPEQLKLMMPAAPAKKSGKSADAALKSSKPALGKQPAPQADLSEPAVPSVQEPVPTEEPQPSKPPNYATAPEEKTTMPEATKSEDFETMLCELEKVVAQLYGELKLEEALALFERGMGLSKDCEEFLRVRAAENRSAQTHHQRLGTNRAVRRRSRDGHLSQSERHQKKEPLLKQRFS